MDILIIAGLIILNGLFAMAEIAFVSASRARLEQLAQASAQARHVLQLRKNPEKFLSTIQASITLIGLICGAYSGITLAADVSPWLNRIPVLAPYSYDIALVVVMLAETYFSIVFGELIPKTFGMRNPEKTICRLIEIVQVVSIILYPLVVVLSFSVRTFYHLLGGRRAHEDQRSDTLQQILAATRVAATEQKIAAEQEMIIQKAIAISDLKLKNIMVERSDIKHLNVEMSMMDALLEAHTHQHTRYPVLDRAQDRYIGYVNFKDIINVLRFDPQHPSLRSICRPIITMDLDRPIIEALKTMIGSSQHIALVTDGEQRTVGIITLENILETIVGDIRDEYDLLPEYCYRIAENRYLAGGKITLARLSEMGIPVPRDDISLNEWLAKRLFPNVKVDAQHRTDRAVFIVRRLARGQIYEAIVEVIGAVTVPAP